MRITQDTMLRVAQDAVARQARISTQIMAAYLCGSLLGEDYILGGTADIDLVFVHTQMVEVPREIVRLTDDVHLDIVHHFHRDYREPRALRVHPWLGPTLKSCRVMYDPQHFLDFTQASVRGQFDRTDYIYERARKLLEQARAIWIGLSASREEFRPEILQDYLHILSRSSNSVASLAGPPLTERRFLAGFFQKTAEIGRPELYSGVMGLLGAFNLPPGALGEWLPEWQDACLSIPAANLPAQLHPDRLSYYATGFQALIGSPQPLNMLWPLLRTWTLAVACHPDESQRRLEWAQAMGALGLSGPAFAERILALDAYLDSVDEALEAWARANGVWEG